MSIVIIRDPDSTPSLKLHVIESPSANEPAGSFNTNPPLVIIISVVFIVIVPPSVLSTYVTSLGSVTGVNIIPFRRYAHLIQTGTGTADGEPSTDTDIELRATTTLFVHGSCDEPITENMHEIESERKLRVYNVQHVYN